MSVSYDDLYLETLLTKYARLEPVNPGNDEPLYVRRKVITESPPGADHYAIVVTNLALGGFTIKTFYLPNNEDDLKTYENICKEKLKHKDWLTENGLARPSMRDYRVSVYKLY